MDVKDVKIKPEDPQINGGGGAAGMNNGTPSNGGGGGGGSSFSLGRTMQMALQNDSESEINTYLSCDY